MSQHAVQSLRLLRNHVLHLDPACQSENFFIGKHPARVGHRNILPDASLIMGKILKNYGNSLSKHMLMRLHGKSADGYAAAVRRENPGQQADKGGLAGAIVSHDGNLFPGADGQMNVRKGFPLRSRVGEAHMIEFDVSCAYLTPFC